MTTKDTISASTSSNTASLQTPAPPVADEADQERADDDGMSRRVTQGTPKTVPETEKPIPVAKSYMDEKGAFFLLKATRLLADSLDIETTLATVAELALPHLGSWCFVDLIEGQSMRRLAIVHPDSRMQTLAAQLLSGWPPKREDPLGAPMVARTRRTEVVFPVTDEMLVNASRTPENLAILRALQIGSLMTVPLIARGEVLGAITYVSPNHGDSFSEQDVALAEDLAARCAIAIDNSRLFGDALRAQERAEHANLAKMRFLSDMSHELRTPLNAISGYSEILETGIHGELNEKQLSDVRRIQANQRHLLGLVESVLSYARLDAGKAKFNPENVPLAGIFRETETIIAPLAEEKRITYRGWDTNDQGEVIVYADREKLQQILINLLANAIKFTPEDGWINITYQALDKKVEIRVSDSGIGIAPEHLKTIFEAFMQVEDGLTKTSEGTGLGLAISKELAVRMGGDLYAESEPGRGSTFTLVLLQGDGGADYS